MRIQNYIQKVGIISAFITSPLVTVNSLANVSQNSDTFIKTIRTVPAKGSSEKALLLNAPNPNIEIAGENKIAKIVVDLSENILYKYDEEGNAKIAYLIASGKKTTPTDKGVRIVTHIETYPYRTAPRGTKRRRNPGAYGPKIICLNKIDTKTGIQSQTGEFIHGTNNPGSIGKYVSQGCMRMDNEVIKTLVKEVKRGDIVVIK